LFERLAALVGPSKDVVHCSVFLLRFRIASESYDGSSLAAILDKIDRE